ncbi:MAG: hypothetical protein KGN80_09305 [Acidobacteriota bacterium]|nr:hypothetical protein [Acidobacteriota bacterium]
MSLIEAGPHTAEFQADVGRGVRDLMSLIEAGPHTAELQDVDRLDEIAVP